VIIVFGALGAVAQGVDAGFNFGCKQGWWSCLPSAGRPARAVAPQPTAPAPPAAAPPSELPAPSAQPAPPNLTPGSKFR
jgi:hypothetical protein